MRDNSNAAPVPPGTASSQTTATIVHVPLHPTTAATRQIPNKPDWSTDLIVSVALQRLRPDAGGVPRVAPGFSRRLRRKAEQQLAREWSRAQARGQQQAARPGGVR